MIRTVGVTQMKYCYRININFSTNTIYSICFPRKQLLSAKTVEKRLARASILFSRLEAGTLPNLVFSDEKKFDVQHHVNPQNDRVGHVMGR